MMLNMSQKSMTGMPQIEFYMQANTVPATFWSLAFLLLPENQHHKRQVLASLHSVHLDQDTISTSAAETQEYDLSNAPQAAPTAATSTAAAAAALSTEQPASLLAPESTSDDTEQQQAASAQPGLSGEQPDHTLQSQAEASTSQSECC